MTETPAPSLPAAAAQRLSRWLTHLGVSPAAFDDTVGWLTPLWRVHHLQARIVDKRAETPTAVTLVLQVGGAFPLPRAGQHLVVGVTLQGVRHRRAYSPRVLPQRPGCIAITVQRQRGGRVSTHLHDAAREGDVLDVEAPAGDFVLPQPVPPAVLLIAGGSGITPFMAMLGELRRRAPATQVTLLYFARSERDRILARELTELSQRWTSFTYLPLEGSAPPPDTPPPPRTEAAVTAPRPHIAPRRLTTALLQERAPHWARTLAFCCGPATLMAAARGIWAEAGIARQLRLEAFTAPEPSGRPDTRHHVTLRRPSQPVGTQDFHAPAHLTLLAAGEQAGLQLPHGCRQGICHQCSCRLQRGSVQDLLSGQRVDGQGQAIRLCVSAALSDLALESLN